MVEAAGGQAAHWLLRPRGGVGGRRWTSEGLSVFPAMSFVESGRRSALLRRRPGTPEISPTRECTDYAELTRFLLDRA